MAKIVFYCHDTIENIGAMEYYRQDVLALRELGHEVVVCNRYRDLPWRFDALLVWWWTYALIPILLAKLSGRPAIVTGTFNFRFDSRATGVDYFHRPWYQRVLIALALKLASANVYVGKREFAAVSDYFGIRTAHYMPHCVGDDYFLAGSCGRPRTLMLNLAWSGVENLQRKGVWTILEAATLLKARGIAFELVLAGKKGNAFPALQQRVAELGLKDCVSAIGEVSYKAKLDLFSKTKLYLQPSFYEGFGLATAEAMAAGCCVITSDVGEVSTVVGNAGIYVPPDDANALADAIERLLASPGEVDELGAAAVERMRKLFSFERKKENFDALLTPMGLPCRSN